MIRQPIKGFWPLKLLDSGFFLSQKYSEPCNFWIQRLTLIEDAAHCPLLDRSFMITDTSCIHQMLHKLPGSAIQVMLWGSIASSQGLGVYFFICLLVGSNKVACKLL